MTSTSPATAPVDPELAVTATLTCDNTPGGWTVVYLAGSSETFGTRKPVKVRGTLDGHEFRATLLPMGDGTHMLPVRAALRRAVGKSDGADVRVALRRA
ncbi:DUF1905 domain-containing protein [Nakamurella sp. YIM 132087]|uniref:DUF1905 domain-containing protein n=1 Tax=Nakamurella alba TaxID=2665158 RepID=A0A7K1FRR2_9ACTN|nr:DUF1905 domain-containing protein [Nakamurella alba]MTD16831.1 DUF1905 domain-containing protein [Nakamurella alba]